MDKNEISTLKKGKVLNTRVAEEVMGHRVITDEILGDLEIQTDDNGDNVYGPLPAYSENISSAGIVVERMLELGYGEATFWKDEMRPEVICRAALLTVSQKKKEISKKEKKSKLRIVT